MIKASIYIGLTLLTLLIFNSISILSFKLGLSWTLSKALPYILLVLFGFLLMLKLGRFLPFKSKLLVKILLFVIMIAPFSIGFIFHPIYEGDFSKAGKEIQNSKRLAEFRNSDLVVVTMPGCKFCIESTHKITQLQERNPKMRINYILCSTDKNTMEELRSLLPKTVKIKLAKNTEELLKITDRKFPSFLKIEKSKATYLWGNNQFGVRALDWMEDGQGE